jgi:hypothetical protein
VAHTVKKSATPQNTSAIAAKAVQSELRAFAIKSPVMPKNL